MSFIVLSRALVGASFGFAGSAALASGAHPLLSCEAVKVEQSALKQAPAGARRVSKHVLEIVSRKGPKRFLDKPPHEKGDMGGLHWRYCAYFAGAKAHLIGMADEGLFSGKLLFNESGKLVRAGHTVVFSPDDKEFLAVEQDDGMDGETWTVNALNGRTKWKGYAGALSKVDGVDMVVATFDHPRWTGDGRLTAQFSCASSKIQGVTTLVHFSSGGWKWRGHEQCL